MSSNLSLVVRPTTNLVPSEEPRPLTTEAEQLAALAPESRHGLLINQAIQSVIAEVRMPLVRNPGTMTHIGQAVALAHTQRELADTLARESPAAGPQPGWVEAENAAQAQDQYARKMIEEHWPVDEWCGALHQAATSAARLGAWSMLAEIADAMTDVPGSVGWWAGVEFCHNLWGNKRRR